MFHSYFSIIASKAYYHHRRHRRHRRRHQRLRHHRHIINIIIIIIIFIKPLICVPQTTFQAAFSSFTCRTALWDSVLCNIMLH